MEPKITYEQYKQALKTINVYYRQITGRAECVIFHMNYIQPIETHITEIEIQQISKPAKE